ncbi:MAG: PQQ-binding-like beta-propeller repeat protein [Gemmatimonadetes bacterium]|nr:PQQ-binding-like beta-propeller repeat protein [Gemmatimonadota bacterium]
MGAALASAIVVKVTDARGTGVSGTAVTFAAVSGGGSISPSSATSDASGLASATWTLGTTPITNTATASAAGLSGSPVTFTASARAGAPAQLTKVRGDTQMGAVNGALTDSLVVRATDSFGNAVAGAAVSWAATAGGGSVSPASSSTDASGQAKTRWTLGTGVTQTATASAAGVTAVTFTAALPAWRVFHGNPQHTGQALVNGPQAATLRWRYTAAGITEGTGFNSMAVDRLGNVYVNGGNKVSALSSGGQVLWTTSMPGIGATALSNDETTVYAVGGGTLRALSAATGQPIWSYTVPTPSLGIFGEPNVASDGTIYFGSWDRHVYALTSGGTLKWRYQTDGSIAPLASPALSPDEQTIYVGTGDPNSTPGGSLVAIRSDGTLRWQVKLDNARVSGAAVGRDGKVYATGSGRLHAFNADGSRVWESGPDVAGSLAPSLSTGGVIVSGTSRDGKVYGINASTGQTLWSYQTGQNPNYNPTNPHQPQYGVLVTPVFGREGTVYVGAIDGVMYAFSSAGSLLWRYQTGNSLNEACPAIGPDGTLYFGSADAYLYALKSP